ncbi:ClpXP protease specificity-enhancing factor SspB [Leptospira kmetyi]|uniref:Stringent starvation protein B n=1 Tax=Leptospira kmetyi TaxID=408139 RepID=A0A2M9XRG0_9LEPT|nr:ClpXP protease specificity-enhancing factor SspB [Leptospira kmetyi]AYV57961.1 stringent starvation protein B [Leptospira kmetyi]EQA55575.1 stringent starvation protein B-like protein [Leptospira kmetyi serovar Malaysia str. Bejo-Iso9]PJZ27975.1 stringent starvation protein B [Leptospira kmetyi]PJZ41826.1 stringent starvation protein B [Leptospira kmetyi]TGK14911.1 stringent starvation protein B [Leptospira kmetyi]
MDKQNLKEEILTLRKFKRSLFDLYWDQFGTFYLHALPHPQLVIGKRGLVGDEKESGIVLVFSPKGGVRNLDAGEEWIYAELQFGYTWEEVFIPWDCILRYFDKTQQTLTNMKVFTTEPEIFKKDSPSAEKTVSTEKKEGDTKDDKSNVIQVDFGSKSKQ